MKREFQLTFLCAALSIVLSFHASSQCPQGLNGPFPIPEYQNFNCAGGACDNPQLINASWQPGDFWQLQVPNMLLFTDYVIDFSVDPNTGPIANQLEITVFDANSLNVVAHAPSSLELIFQLPYQGIFYLTISQVDFCGAPPTMGPFNGFFIDAFCPLYCPLDRFAASQILLSDPQLVFNPAEEFMFCPFSDFGYGGGFEGMLPPGTLFGSALELILPEPQPPTEISVPSYLFYHDPNPDLLFTHDVFYYIVDATDPAPSIGGGTIQVIASDWWPFLFPPGVSNPFEIFNTSDLYYSFEPDGPENPEGIIAGPVLSPNFNELYTDCVPLVAKANNKCAIIISGSNENKRKNAVKRQAERLNQRDCYDKDNIVTLNNSTKAQFCDTLFSMLRRNPACEEFCIYVFAHGSSRGGFELSDGLVSPNDWQQKMDSIAKYGITTHITFNTCHSAALGNPFNWNLPKGSSVTFASGAAKSAFSYTYKTPACDTITESIFTHAIETCRGDIANADANDDGVVSHKEGVKWVLTDQPCYTKIDAPLVMRYPAGSAATPGAYNPEPSLVCIGKSPSSFSKRYKMPAAGGNTDKVCLVVQGDRRQGTGLVYTASGNTFIQHTTTTTFNAVANETTICFQAIGGCFLNCVNYWFHWYDGTGKQIRHLRSFATDCPIPGRMMATDHDLPTTDVQAALGLDGTELNISVFNRGTIGGGIGEPCVLDIRYRIGNDSIPIAELNPGHAAYAALPLFTVATAVALDTNSSFDFTLSIPEMLLPGQYVFVETDQTWSANGNETSSIDQFSATETAVCKGNITYTPVSAIPDLTNSSGIISLDSVTISNMTSAFNAGLEIHLLPGTFIPFGNETTMYILGCDED